MRVVYSHHDMRLFKEHLAGLLTRVDRGQMAIGWPPRASPRSIRCTVRSKRLSRRRSSIMPYPPNWCQGAPGLFSRFLRQTRYPAQMARPIWVTPMGFASTPIQTAPDKSRRQIQALRAGCLTPRGRHDGWLAGLEAPLSVKSRASVYRNWKRELQIPKNRGVTTVEKRQTFQPALIAAHPRAASFSTLDTQAGCW